MTNQQLLSLKIPYTVSQMQGKYFIFLNMNKSCWVNGIFTAGLVFGPFK